MYSDRRLLKSVDKPNLVLLWLLYQILWPAKRETMTTSFLFSTCGPPSNSPRVKASFYPGIWILITEIVEWLNKPRRLLKPLYNELGEFEFFARFYKYKYRWTTVTALRQSSVKFHFELYCWNDNSQWLARFSSMLVWVAFEIASIYVWSIFVAWSCCFVHRETRRCLTVPSENIPRNF